MKRILAITLLVTVALGAGCGTEKGVNSSGDGPEGRLYVLNQGDNTIYIYDTRTMAILDTVETVVDLPHYIEFSPDGATYYVTTLETSGHIAKFRTSTNEFLGSVAVPPAVMPSAIAITSDGQYGYISNFSVATERSFIHKYDLQTLTHVDELQSGATTHDLKITSDGASIIACNRFSNDLTVIRTADDDVSFVGVDPDVTYPLGTVKYGPMGVIIDHRDSLALIACLDINQVRYYDLAARAIVDSVNIPVTGSAAMAGPMLLAITPDNATCFLTTQLGNSIVAFDIASGDILADIPVGTQAPFGISMSDDGSRVYVACVGGSFAHDHGRVYVIDTKTRTKVDSVDVGNQSYGLIWRGV